MWTAKFWKQAAERAIKTTAQSGVALIGATALITEVNWAVVAGGAALAGVLSVLTSIASAGSGPDPESPSVV